MSSQATSIIDICFVHFRTLRLEHLEAAWYSLSRQDFNHIRRVNFLDNNTEHSQEDIEHIFAQHRLPVPILAHFKKHNDNTKTQSWSVNHTCRDMARDANLIFFTRADYILDFDCIRKFYSIKQTLPSNSFVTSYAYHMAYDERGDQRIDAFRDIEIHKWRQRSVQILLHEVNGWKVDSSDTDAGVWLTDWPTLNASGWMDERLHLWGYQQTEFQKRIKEIGTHIHQIPEFLFFHQHHAAPRSYDLAKQQLEEIKVLDKVAQFRPNVLIHTGSVCDELDKK